MLQVQPVILQLKRSDAISDRNLRAADLAEQFSDLLSVLGSVDVPESSRFLLSLVHPPLRHFIHIALLNGGHDLWRTKHKQQRTHMQGTKGSSAVSL